MEPAIQVVSHEPARLAWLAHQVGVRINDAIQAAKTLLTGQGSSGKIACRQAAALHFVKELLVPSLVEDPNSFGMV